MFPILHLLTNGLFPSLFTLVFLYLRYFPILLSFSFVSNPIPLFYSLFQPSFSPFLSSQHPFSSISGLFSFFLLSLSLPILFHSLISPLPLPLPNLLRSLPSPLFPFPPHLSCRCVLALPSPFPFSPPPSAIHFSLPFIFNFSCIPFLFSSFLSPLFFSFSTHLTVNLFLFSSLFLLLLFFYSFCQSLYLSLLFPVYFFFSSTSIFLFINFPISSLPHFSFHVPSSSFHSFSFNFSNRFLSILLSFSLSLSVRLLHVFIRLPFFPPFHW